MKKKLIKYVGIALFIGMIILIFIVSPRITNAIQNGAKYLYELEGTYITRVVELILSITLVASVFITKETVEKGGKK